MLQAHSKGCYAEGEAGSLPHLKGEPALASFASHLYGERREKEGVMQLGTKAALLVLGKLVALWVRKARSSLHRIRDFFVLLPSAEGLFLAYGLRPWD